MGDCDAPLNLTHAVGSNGIQSFSSHVVVGIEYAHQGCQFAARDAVDQRVSQMEQRH